MITILVFGAGMSLFALLGGVLVFLPDWVFERSLQPLVAFAAGSLIGGAFFHMMPHAMMGAASPHVFMMWVVAGFTAVFALDQLLEWRQFHNAQEAAVRPLGPLLLAADGLHNLVGGLAIGAIFLTDVRAGLAAWLAAALHEIPQEIGDFGALVHSGYSRVQALLYNFISALAFPLGGGIAYFLGQGVDVYFFVAIGAGSFLYIAAADLIPEVKRARRLRGALARFLFFAMGVGLLYLPVALLVPQ